LSMGRCQQTDLHKQPPFGPGWGSVAGLPSHPSIPSIPPIIGGILESHFMREPVMFFLCISRCCKVENEPHSSFGKLLGDLVFPDSAEVPSSQPRLTN
jgi:hypothetical protein